MKRTWLYLILTLSVAIPANQVEAGSHRDLQAVSTLMDSAQILETNVFAPKAWKQAVKEFKSAQRSVDYKKKEKNIQKYIGRAREYTENSIRATQVANLSLAEYLEPRNKAKAAKAPMRVAELYAKAEIQFMKATEKVEKGDVKGGLKEAAKASPLFDKAEMEAIRSKLLGMATNLIKKAKVDEADKHALVTLDRARTAFARADAILVRDRYERKESLEWIAKAEYEARHASNIAQSVRSLKRNDQAWEKLIMVYEIQMNRVGEAAGLEHLPFDNGPLAAADTLIQYVQQGQSTQKAMQMSHAMLEDMVSKQLRETLARAGDVGGTLDVLELAQMVDQRMAMTLLERDDLASQNQTSEVKLAQVEREQATMSRELDIRLAREERFNTAKRLIRPSEGEVLWNAANDLVLRLIGLSFGINSSQITDNQLPLLEKVVEIIRMFPDAQLVVEGHTDATGDPGANLQLSERRAYALMMHLRTATGMSSNRVRAIGYGAERPIASNSNREGRAKNRRNDIIIMQ